MILNRLGEPDRCPSCKVTLENRNYDITHRHGESEGCTPRPLCQRINHHLVLPLLLLPVILLLLGIVRLIARPEQETLLFKSSAEALNGKHSLEEFEDRDLINGIKTSFVPLLTNALPLNVLPLSHPRRKRRRRRHIREVFGLHDVENVSAIDTIVWAAVKPPFKHDRKVADENKRQRDEGNDEYSDKYEPEAFQDDEQEIEETESPELSIKERRNNWEKFWNGKNDEESIRKAQAQTMLTLMNSSVDPCEDFYEYACGRWVIAHPIPKNRAGSDTFEILRSNIDAVVRRLLENDLDLGKTDKFDAGAGLEDRSKLSDIMSAREGTSHEEMGPNLPVKPFIKLPSMVPTAKHLEMKRNNEKALPPDVTTDKNQILKTLEKNDVARDPLLILSDLYETGTSSEEAKGFVNGDFSLIDKDADADKTSLEQEETPSTVADKNSVKARVKKSTAFTPDISMPENLDVHLHSHESQLSNKAIIESSALDQRRLSRDALLPTGSSEEVIDVLKNEFVQVTEEANRPINNSDLVHPVQKSEPVEKSSLLQDQLIVPLGSNDKNSIERVMPKGNSTEGLIDEGRGARLENSSDRVVVTLNKGTNRIRVKLVSQPFSVIHVGNNKTNDSDFEMKTKSTTREIRSEKEDNLDDISSGSKGKWSRPNDAIRKARSLYQSCMNIDIIQKRNEMPLVKLLEELSGGWPVQTKPLTSFEWTSLAAKLRLFNNNILIAEWVGPDIRNSSEYVVQLDEAGLGLPTRDYFLSTSNTEAVKAYRKFIVTIANLLGATTEEAEKLMDQIVNFEIHLALITATHEEKKNLSELYHKMTVDELSIAVPGINWRQYLGTIMESTHPNFNVSSLNSTMVVVFALRYFRDLANLLDKYPPRVIQSYMLWRFASHRAVNLDLRFLAAISQLRKMLTGREEEPPRWETCVAHTTAALGHAVGSLFVKRYFDEQSKSDTLRMTTEIRTAFRESILDPNGATATWMDKGTRSLAVDKADAMALRVGYPDSILDPELLDLRYADLKIDPGLYFENTLAVLKYLTWREHSFLGMPVDKTQWSASPTEVNAFYSRNKNQILLPAGILQPPFYHRHFPRSLNYGGVGVVIGHEMTHGFDIRGRLFDRNGNLQRWWQPPAVEAFQKRAMCLIDQYSQYFVDEVSMQIDGVRTQGENIADNGGIKQAYKAYEDWLRRHGEGKSGSNTESLPGLNASPRQLFFLNFAQVWCGALRPEAIRNKLKTSIHSLGKFRVIGALSNSEDFASAFSCPVGSPMNPQVKCSVW